MAKTLDEKRKAAAEAARRWRANNPERAREIERAAYHRRQERLGLASKPRGQRSTEEKRAYHRERQKAWREANPEKASANRKRHYDKNAEQQRQKAREWYHANKDRARATARRTQLRRRYGLTEEQFAALGTACWICGATEDSRMKPDGTPFRLAVDHDHDTGKVRGLLCGHCNSGIGYFKHDIALLKQAMAYLERTA